MAAPENTVQAKLTALRNAFLAQVPGKLQQIVESWDAVAVEWQPVPAEGLRRLLHTLAGTAGTFGLAAVRVSARKIEAELKKVLESGTPPGESARAAIRSEMAVLTAACGVADASTAEQHPLPVLPALSVPIPPDRHLVLIVDDDRLLSESLALQIGYYGYATRMIGTLAALAEELKTTRPSLIIMDMTFPEGELAGAQALARLPPGAGRRIPVIFLSSRSDFEARLVAVRAGGDAYVTKPVDVGKLVDRIDTLTHRKPREPYRVLVVDDESVLAEYHATVLQQAGMATTVVTDPVQAVRVMADFKPELILMDVYMPECSGMELARVIRQDETFVDIPIVFLSSETDLDKQLLAMSRGGDDFLTKPIRPAHLVASVTLRADRHRALRSFMLFDGLTGLLNHTRTKEELNKEVSRASRQNSPLVFVMIDIDHFKSVNDTYGHPVGDLVIKSLASLLKQRLRSTDVVGRFGGEEFAVILSNTEEAVALSILNQLREDFAKIRHNSQGEAFGVTLSAGLATYAPGRTGAELIEAADKALYAAKRNGRNRACCENACTDAPGQA